MRPSRFMIALRLRNRRQRRLRWYEIGGPILNVRVAVLLVLLHFYFLTTLHGYQLAQHSQIVMQHAQLIHREAQVLETERQIFAANRIQLLTIIHNLEQHQRATDYRLCLLAVQDNNVLLQHDMGVDSAAACEAFLQGRSH